MADFPFDTVLGREDTAAVVAAVESLVTERRLSGQGVSQSGGMVQQFRFAVDEAEQWWEFEYKDGLRQTFRDNVVELSAEDGPRETDFFGSMPQALRMLWPTRILTWANPQGSFYPVLVQPIGRNSLLFTFEHVEDPAFRQTLAIDRTTGIAKRMIGYDYAIILTRIDLLGAWASRHDTSFDTITGPLPTNY